MAEKKRRSSMEKGLLAAGACAFLALAVTPVQGRAVEFSVNPVVAATWSNAEAVNVGNVSTAVPGVVGVRSAVTGDLWANWTGDLSFLDGSSGDGTEEKPYQIATKAELMGLSELAANGMKVEAAEGTYPGDYTGAYFELIRDIDLGGMDWLPIGFYRNSAEMAAGILQPFQGYFDGNGKTIFNFRMYRPEWDHVGLFGAVENAQITDLLVKPGNVITGKELSGLLCGSAKNSVIRDVTVMGTLKTSGTAGGVAGEVLEGSVIENCMADHVALDTGTEKETYTGGIVGKAANSLIADCTVNTGDTKSARIQGGGYVGGIAGFQNDTDIFNVHVMGTIGGSGSQSIGGVSGKYASGRLKVARFEGTIASSGLGSAAREGTFIGTRDTGFHFRYGTEEGADLAYLFADKEEKIAAGICGSGVPEDNVFSYEAHIGFWHSNDNFYTLVQGQNTRPEEEQYFYEQLEEGVLHVIDREDAAREQICSPDHFAPNSVGRPVRGYLVSVLQIDTAANVQNYYDVAALTARGPSAYSHDLDKSHRGAVAAGDTVTVVTAPRNTGEEKYQMDGVPTYTGENGERIDMSYQAGGSYRFVMPDHDTEISAVYKKVAADVKVSPEEIHFQVVQERSGDRKNPSTVTEVRDQSGKLIARYINGELEQGTEVQEIKIASVVDKNNDVADGRVLWSVDDSDLIFLKRNSDEDNEGYTEKSASIELNLDGEFFTEILQEAEKRQAENHYQYPIPDTIYGGGNLGGVAVLTAQTKPSASFEGKPLTANCKIIVTFQIKDRTRIAAEGAVLDKAALTFTVTRRLTGDRKNPLETMTVTAPQTLTAEFSPDYFDKKDIRWTVDDENLIRVDAGGYGEQETEIDYKNASVSALKDTKWIQDIMAADDAVHRDDPYAKRSGSGTRKAVVTVIAEDSLGNRQTASSQVTVDFVTMDRTKVLPEKVELDKQVLEFDMTLTKTGPSGKPVFTWTGIDGQKLGAVVLPAQAETAVSWQTDGTVLTVGEGNMVTPVTDADWIEEAMKKYPYTAEKEVQITAKAGEASASAKAILRFMMVNKTYSSSRSGSGSSGSSSSSRSSLGITTSGTTKAVSGAPKGSVTGTWVQDGAGHWLFTEGGRTYADEWAYIHNPYAKEGQESTSWFRFDADGKMHTGWYLDPTDGCWYYLHETTDGTQGHMYTGWHQLNGRWYFFGTDGRMDKGWHWINGKCYYLDLSDGYMFAGTTTPDGYTVNETGAWTVDGVVQTLGKTP